MKIRSTASVAAVVTAQLFTIIGATASRQIQHAHPQIQRRQATLGAQGCFSSAGSGSSDSGNGAGYNGFQTNSLCGNACFILGKPVAAIFNGYTCYCSDSLPSDSDKVDSSECSSVCPGYGGTGCGGPSTYNVYLTGIDDSVGSDDGSSSASSEASTSAVPTSAAPTPTSSVVVVSTHIIKATTVLQGQETIVQTVAPASTAAAAAETSSVPHSSGSSSDTVGIAVGVVVGVLGLAAIVTFIVFYLRRRRRMKNAENGHARADSLNAFVAGGSTHGSVSDTRLDPRVMVERRRESSGSVFADNQDYSRRILKVTNPGEE